MALPDLIAETRPSFTEATDELLEVHRTVLFSALDGETVAVSFWLSPSSSVIEVESNVTDATAIGAGSSVQPIITIPKKIKMADTIRFNDFINVYYCSATPSEY